MKKLFILLLVTFSLASIADCKGQKVEREDYVCQDGFYFSREGGSTIPIDTALHQGFLSDGTRLFLYKNEREDYAQDSCIVQRVARETEQAVIVVGNIEYEKARRRIEEILQMNDSLKKIPIYTEVNYYRFGGIMSQYEGRIDLRIPIVPAVHPNLRSSSFTLQNLANFCLLSLYTGFRFTELKGKGGLPESVENVMVYPNFILDGKDRESLCFHIEAKPGMEEQAQKDVSRCLEMFAREPCTELQLNLLREHFRQMVKLEYFDSSIYRDQKGRLGNQGILKRIGDAYVLGNELYDYEAEGEYLILCSTSMYSEFINAMYDATILHNPYSTKQ